MRAKKRVAYAKEKLAETGIDARRLEMYHIAASQGPLFAETAEKFTAMIKELMVK